MSINSPSTRTSPPGSCYDTFVSTDDWCPGCLKYIRSIRNPLATANMTKDELRDRNPCERFMAPSNRTW